LSGSGEVYFWRCVWIGVLEVNVEFKSTMCVWGVACSHDQCFQNVHSIFVTPHKYGICMLNWQWWWYVSEFLGLLSYIKSSFLPDELFFIKEEFGFILCWYCNDDDNLNHYSNSYNQILNLSSKIYISQPEVITKCH